MFGGEGRGLELVTKCITLEVHRELWIDGGQEGIRKKSEI